VNDGADLINLSFTLNDLDARPTEREIKRARAMGAVCVAAAGNKGGAVAFPARFPSAVGVSAIGVRDGVPEGADEFQIGSSPRAKGHRNLGVATFSCRGPEIDFTAPGVGVVSLLPGAFGPMSGTSMAAPALTGLLARRLARDAELLGSARDQARSDGIVKLAASVATSVGLPASWEGHGLLPG
jgi:subtilisin